MSKPVADTVPNSPPPRRGRGLLVLGVVLVVGSVLGLVAVLCIGFGGLFLLLGSSRAPVALSPDQSDGYTVGSPRVGSGGPVSIDGLAPVGASEDEISDLPVGGWHTVLSRPASPLGNFDAFASLPWATKLAKRWRADVQLVRMGVDHVRMTGPLDMINDEDADVDYRFYSPGQFELAQAQAEISEAEIPTGFRVWVDEGEVRVMITDVDPPSGRGRVDPNFQPFSGMKSGCDQAKILKVAMAHPKTPRRPAYDFGLRWRFGKAWVIDVDPGDGYVNPTTCASWSP